MRQQPINLIGGFYADESRHWSVQDTLNWLPVISERQGTRTPSKLVGRPGLRPFQQIDSGPIRGMHDCEGRRFVVSGRMLYRISNEGVGIPLGTIPGVGRVSISHNQFKGGSQVLVVNGQPGGGYVYTTSTGAFERIGDSGFPGSLMTDYIDSYLLGVEPGGRYWFHSNLADATDYNALDRYEAEAAPDRIIGIAASQFEVIVFGARTTEFFSNTGGATGTFQSKRAVIDRGCASRHTIAKLDNSVFWLGDDGIVYRMEGYQARRLSTVPLERVIAGSNLANAFAFTWEDRGHKCYILTFPDGFTWCYDVVSGEWVRFGSYGLDRWRLNDLVKWGAKWFGGDFQSGKLWELDWNYPADGDQPLVRERTSPAFADNQSAFTVPKIELICGTGEAEKSQEVAEKGDKFPPQPPGIRGNAPDGVTGQEYSYQYLLWGDGPLTVDVIAGTLPPGLTIDGAGRLSGKLGESSGSYAFTLRVTGLHSQSAALSDAIEVRPLELLPPQLSGWKYLQVARTDDTDYSAADFDDLAWSVGTAPFGGWESDYGAEQIAEGAPGGFTFAPLYDNRFAATFATAWEVNTRLWLRRNLTLSSIPSSGIRVIAYIEDHCKLYVNGDLILSTPAGHNGGTGQTFVLPSSSLVVGSNAIAIQCNDEPPSPGVSVVYADFILEVAT